MSNQSINLASMLLFAESFPHIDESVSSLNSCGRTYLIEIFWGEIGTILPFYGVELDREALEESIARK